MNDAEQGFTEEDHATIAAWRLRLEHLPSLYRYVSIRGDRFAWFCDLALRSLLYFPMISEFNDPFDGAVYPVDDATDQEKREFWERVQVEMGLARDASAIDRILMMPVTEAHKRLRAGHDEAVAQLGVVCLSEVPNDLPMWGYYADGHRGVCLRFNTGLLLRSHEWLGCYGPMPVTYENTYPKINFYRSSPFRRSQSTLATKAVVWSHEREWRIVRHGGPGLVEIPEEAIDGVILGCRVSREDQARVRDILGRRNRPVQVLQANLADSEFRLTIRPA